MNSFVFVLHAVHRAPHAFMPTLEEGLEVKGHLEVPDCQGFAEHHHRVVISRPCQTHHLMIFCECPPKLSCLVRCSSKIIWPHLCHHGIVKALRAP